MSGEEYMDSDECAIPPPPRIGIEKEKRQGFFSAKSDKADFMKWCLFYHRHLLSPLSAMETSSLKWSLKGNVLHVCFRKAFKPIIAEKNSGK